MRTILFHPSGEGIALEAMRLVKEWLPIAVEDGQRIEGRAFMLAASSMGAVAFPEAARMAEHDPSNDGNPVPMKATDYEGLFRKAITGVR